MLRSHSLQVGTYLGSVEKEITLNKEVGWTLPPVLLVRTTYTSR